MKLNCLKYQIKQHLSRHKRWYLSAGIPPLLLCLALFLVRLELLSHTHIAFGQAWEAGFIFGLYFDLMVCLYPSILAALLSALIAIPPVWIWSLGAFVIWFVNLGNVVHTMYFGTRLDWWIVALHWQDFFVVQDSVLQLGSTWLLFLSMLLVGSAIVSQILRSVRLKSVSYKFWSARALSFTWALTLCLVSLVAWKAPKIIGGYKAGLPIADNIIRTWISQTTSEHLYAGAGKDWFDKVGKGLKDNHPEKLGKQLIAYREYDQFKNSATEVAFDDSNTSPIDSAYPLYRYFQTSPEITLALRKKLGLPLRDSINVVMLFVESLRAWEFFHPVIGPQIFPQLREILKHHAIVFSQAYSSSFTAGQTVRGQFSTLCSMLPNMMGAAVYMAHNLLRIRCLAQVLKEHGYLTTWMNTYRKSYHGKQAFEMLHGTERFFDRDDFKARGVTQQYGRWGLADKDFLSEVVNLLEELDEARRPVFINALTVSSHHPYRMIPEGVLPDSLRQATQDHGYYQKYLSGLRYEDIAVGAFFEKLFKSSVADHTLVVLLADHSAFVKPHLPLRREQKIELQFRIPIAFVTKQVPNPETISRPVHQVDVAPTLARILGLSGPVTWVGRGLFQSRGSPWLYVTHHALSYRTHNRGCYKLSSRDRLRCFMLQDKDLLFAEHIAEVPVDEREAQFFYQLALANMQAIVFNAIQPSIGIQRDEP